MELAKRSSETVEERRACGKAERGWQASALIIYFRGGGDHVQSIGIASVAAHPCVRLRRVILVASLLATLGFTLVAAGAQAAVGPYRVLDINPGVSSSAPGSLVDVNGIVYFAANDGTHGSGIVEERRDDAGHGDGQGHQSEREFVAPSFSPRLAAPCISRQLMACTG